MSRVAAPAGWYADPGEPAQLRWWTGTEWATGTVAPAPAASAPPRGRRPKAPRVEAPGATASDSTRTSTPWVWLAVACGVLPLYALWFVDGVSIAQLVGLSVLPSASSPPELGWVVGGVLVLAFVALLSVTASVVFAWLDAAALRRRGVERPFPWLAALSAFVISIGGYLIGRAVVLRRRGLSGWAPVWVWLVLTLAGLVAGLVWLDLFVDALWALVMRLS